ncbi:MAG: hybrid sensor histidine kinase/response regulator [Rickettsiales bacterium]
MFLKRIMAIHSYLSAEDDPLCFQVFGMIFLILAIVSSAFADLTNTFLMVILGSFGICLANYKLMSKSFKKIFLKIIPVAILLSLTLVFVNFILFGITYNIWCFNILFFLAMFLFCLDWKFFAVSSLISPVLAYFILILVYHYKFQNFSTVFFPQLVGYYIWAIIATFLLMKANNYIVKSNNMVDQDSSADLTRDEKIRISELEATLVSKTEFLNNMSHEVRTPIQGFTTLSEGLVTHWEDFSEEKRYDLALQVSNNARRLASLVTNLLDFSKFTADKMIMDFQQVELNSIIEDMINECNELYLSNKKIEIKFTPTEKSGAFIDINRVHQVLRNFFVNAIKFSADNSVIHSYLNHDILDGKAALHFIIKDSGVGVPVEEIESIFDPFIQSSRTRNASNIGTGLGLSICKKIINAHNGKIWAENNKEGGASFHFVIPVKQFKSNLFENETQEFTILMIDDEEICLSSMELLLMNSKYTLIKACGGKEGLEYLKNNRDAVDIILLDLMMPDVYGLTLLEEVKMDSELAKIPVILQSGTSDKEAVQRAYNMGIFSFISKPYQRNIIVDEIKKAIDFSLRQDQV